MADNINLFKNHLDPYPSSGHHVNLSIHIDLNHSEPEVQNNFIMLAYCSHCVYNLFIRAGNRGRWPASVKLVTL